MSLLDFSPSETDTYNNLIAMDFNSEKARKAVKAKGPNIEACIEFIFTIIDDPIPSSYDVPPPLIPVSDYDPPPYGGTDESGQWDAALKSSVIDLTKAPPASPTTAVIDLTQSPPLSAQLTLGPPDSKSNYATTYKGKEKEKDLDSDLDAAMAMSLSHLEDNDRPNGAGELRKAEERIRSDLNEPVILRSLPPLLSGLAAYFQCLYAVPFWRNIILNFTSDSENVRRKIGFENYWKGIHEDTTGTHNDDEKILGLQRLFLLMKYTRRSYLHISEITDTLDLLKEDYRHTTNLPSKLTELHTEIGQMCIRYERYKMRSLYENEFVTDDEIHREAISFFAFTGTEVAQKDMRGPMLKLPFADEISNASEVLKLPIRPGDTLFRALDNALTEEIPPRQSLLVTPPIAFALQFTRFVNMESLDSFGSNGDVEKYKNKVLDLPRTLWLDKYCLSNKVEIADGKELQDKLEKEILELEKKRDKLAVTEDGKSGVELVKTALTYFQQAISEDPERIEKQKALATQYELVLDVMTVKISEYETKIAELRSQYDSVFETPEMQKTGPYVLTSFIMRNGLNGRGSAWSVVKDDAGQWWKIVDLEKTKVDIEQALRDPTGLQMNAGITMAFYQLATPLDVPELVESQSIREAIRLDNRLFADELSPDLTSTWDIDHIEPVQVINMSDLRGDPTTPEAMEISQTPSMSDGEILNFDGDEKDYSTSTSTSTSNITATKRNTDEIVSDSDDEVAMSLRGGAGQEKVADYEDDDEDDEGENEDEVELGCLVPMKKGVEWDVDFNVGKVGGKPVWLDPESPLATSDVTCGVCNRLMNLLLQLNSPDDERPHAAARSLYIFACPGNNCISKDAKKALKVWRIQTSSPNAFFPKTDETIAKRKLLESQMDLVTGLSDRSTAGVSALPPWTEFDIETEEEPYEESYLPDTSPTSTGDNEESSEDASEPNTQSGVDVAFLKFQERLARLPEQVLRFYRLPGIEEPAPLWVSSQRIDEEKEIMKCDLCGGKRKVEFQILSTLLSHISADLEFDTLLIFTCMEHCLIPKRGSNQSGWQEEVIVKLNFSEGGARLEGLRPE